MFRILIVDDDRIGAYLLREVMKNLRHPHELHFVWDGVEAIEFLHRRGAYENAPRPNLILLDLNMPRLGGLETLYAIKGDPELYMIPVIMFSSSDFPEDVRESYRGRANCYVQKPTDLDRSVKFVQAVETFWMDFALLPGDRPRPGRDVQIHDSEAGKSGSKPGLQEPRTGQPIATPPAEVRSPAIKPVQTASPGGARCEERSRLLDEFGAAVRRLLELHEQQFAAIVAGDAECERFDLLIHMANEDKQMAKYAYLRHTGSHGCANDDALE